MSLAAFIGSPEFPRVPKGWSGAAGFNSYLLDAAGEKFAVVLHAPKTGNIRKIGFRTATVTTGATVDVRIEQVDPATGDPNGSLFGVNTNVAHVINNADDNVWLTTAALTADAAVTQGDLIAVVIAVPAGANLNISELAEDSTSNGPVFPYIDHFTAAWAKTTRGGGAMLALEYSDGSYVPIPNCWAFGTATTDTFNSGSTPDEYALKFKLPFPARIKGCWAVIDQDGDCDIVLYDSDGTTALLTKSMDKDVRADSAARCIYITFPGTADLAKDTFYYLSVKPTSVTNLTVYRLQLASAALMDAMEGGQNFHGATRTDAGAWTAVTTDRPMIGLMLSGFDDGAGGSATTHGFSGGI